MNLDKVTIEDCIQMAMYKNKYVIINVGQVVGWVEEGDRE